MTNRRGLTAFYLVVALIALAGQALAAVEWLGWPLITAIAAVAALELGGVVLSQHALARMQLGETATAARLLSAAVAGFAVAFNWYGHSDVRQGAFFAGMSALGYAVWLLDSAARRRDQLRATRMLAVPPPAFGLLRWLGRPVLTWQARSLAIETPALGMHGSLEAAAAARRTAARRAAISKVLHRKIRAAVDPTTADIAVAVYDLDEVAIRLAAGADYDGLTALIGADLLPTRLAPVTTAGSTVVEREPERVPAEIAAIEVPADTPVIAEVSEPAALVAVPAIETAEKSTSQAVERTARKPKRNASSSVPKRTASATQAAAQALANTGMNTEAVAQMLGISERYARQLLGSRELPSATDVSAPVHDDQDDDVERVNGAKIEMSGVTA